MTVAPVYPNPTIISQNLLRVSPNASYNLLKIKSSHAYLHHMPTKTSISITTSRDKPGKSTSLPIHNPLTPRRLQTVCSSTKLFSILVSHWKFSTRMKDKKYNAMEKRREENTLSDSEAKTATNANASFYWSCYTQHYYYDDWFTEPP